MNQDSATAKALKDLVKDNDVKYTVTSKLRSIFGRKTGMFIDVSDDPTDTIVVSLDVDRISSTKMTELLNYFEIVNISFVNKTIEIKLK